MNRRFFRGRFFWIMVFIAVFLIGFILSCALGATTTSPHKQLFGFIATPFQTVGTVIKNAFTSVFGSVAEYDALKKENETLRSEKYDMELQLDEYYYLEYENGQLKSLLGINDNGADYIYQSALVVSRSSDGWNSSLTINRGTSSGIEVRDIVVTGDGLVGIVSDAGPNWASVTTVTDPATAVGALASRTKNIGMIEGTAELRLKGLCRLVYMDKDVSVNRGDAVVTSGLGGTYPEGLRIGTITDFVYDDNGLSMYALIQPSVDIESVTTVYVITNFSSEGILDD